MRRSISSRVTPASVRARTSESSCNRARFTRSVHTALTSVAKSVTPGKAEAKITPVSSRSASGSRQVSGSCVPRVVSL